MSDTDKKIEVPHIETIRYFKESGQIVKEEEDSEAILLRKHPDDVPLAEVEYGVRQVVNLYNYETCQVSISIRLPTPVEEVEECFAACKSLVDAKIQKEVMELTDFAKARKDRL